MATVQIPILGWSALPDSSGQVYFEPLTIKASNDVWAYLVAILNDTATRIGLFSKFPVPLDYVGSPSIIVVWTTTATSGDAEFDFDYRAVGGNDSESLDQAGVQESVNQNDTAPSASMERMEVALSLTAGNFAAGDTVQCALYRDGTDGGDTIAAAVQLHEVLFQYSNS